MSGAKARKQPLIQSRLSPQGRIVLNALIALAGTSLLTCPSLHQLERLTCIRRRTLQRTLVRLCNSYHLQIVPRFDLDGAQLANRFEINHVGDLHD